MKKYSINCIIYHNKRSRNLLTSSVIIFLQIIASITYYSLGVAFLSAKIVQRNKQNLEINCSNEFKKRQNCFCQSNCKCSSISIRYWRVGLRADYSFSNSLSFDKKMILEVFKKHVLCVSGITREYWNKAGNTAPEFRVGRQEQWVTCRSSDLNPCWIIKCDRPTDRPRDGI